MYQLHHYDHTVPLAETLGAMDALVHAGLVRSVGCSNYFAWQIAEAMGIAAEHGLTALVSAQMMYNLIRRDLEREHVACAARYGVGLIAYGPLHSGMLAGGWTSRAQIPPTSRIGEYPEVYLGDEARAFGITAVLVDAAAALGATPGQLASRGCSGTARSRRCSPPRSRRASSRSSSWRWSSRSRPRSRPASTTRVRCR